MTKHYPAPGARCGVRGKGNGEVTEVLFGKKRVVITVKLAGEKAAVKLERGGLIGWAGAEIVTEVEE